MKEKWDFVDDEPKRFQPTYSRTCGFDLDPTGSNQAKINAYWTVRKTVNDYLDEQKKLKNFDLISMKKEIESIIKATNTMNLVLELVIPDVQATTTEATEVSNRGRDKKLVRTTSINIEIFLKSDPVNEINFRYDPNDMGIEYRTHERIILKEW